MRPFYRFRPTSIVALLVLLLTAVVISLASPSRGFAAVDPKAVAKCQAALAKAGYVTAIQTDNGFKITPSGVVTQLIGPAGEGQGHPLESPGAVAIGAGGTVYVAGQSSDNVFKITANGTITEISFRDREEVRGTWRASDKFRLRPPGR